MSLFGTVIPWQKNVSAEINGLQVANEGFLKALLRYSELDAFHIFLNPSQIDGFYSSWKNVINDGCFGKQVQIKSTWELVPSLSQHAYTVFHAGDPYINNLANLRKAFASVDFPITGRTHSLCQDTTLNSFRNILLSPIMSHDSILCSTRAVKHALEKIFKTVMIRTEADTGLNLSFPGRLDVVPLGIEPEEFNHIKRDEARKRLNIPKELTIILCLGRVSVWDKMDLFPMIHALNDLVEERHCKDILLYIVGTADMEDSYLKSLLMHAHELNLGDHLLFNFNFEPSLKPYFYAAADIFVSIPDNTQESFGIAPVEAMSAGLPVVLSDWNGYRELIEDGTHGYLIPTFWDNFDLLMSPPALYQPRESLLSLAQGVAMDSYTLVESLYHLIQNPEMRLKMGEAARKRALKRFTWEKVISGYEELLGEISQGTPKQKKESRGAVHIPYYEIFGHYASSALGDKLFFQSTYRGRRIYQKSESGLAYKALSHMVQRDIVFKIIELTHVPRDLSYIRNEISVPDMLIKYNIAWMMKTDLIRVVAEPSQAAIDMPMEHIKSLMEMVHTGEKRFQEDEKDQDRRLDSEWDIMAQAAMTSVSYPDDIRAEFYRPLVNFMIWQLRKGIGQLDGSPDKSLLVHMGDRIAQLLDEFFLQAIAMFMKEMNYADESYPEAVQVLLKSGDIQYLAERYPLWAEAVLGDVKHCISHFQRFARRMAGDMADLFKFFQGDTYDPMAVSGKITRLHFPGKEPRSIFSRVMILELDHNLKLAYKDRDIRIDDRIMGNTTNRDNEKPSLAEQLDHWMNLNNGIPTCRFFSRVDSHGSGPSSHYGYMEYIPKDTPEHHFMSEDEASRYYETFGCISIMLLLLGLGDLHHDNLIIYKGKPYFTDLEMAFEPRILSLLEKEINDQELEYPDTLEETALESMKILNTWNCHHKVSMAFTDVETNDHQLIRKNPVSYEAVYGNFINVEDQGNSLDSDLSGLHRNYAHFVENGFLKAFDAICEHYQEFMDWIDSVSELPVRYCPVGDIYHLTRLSEYHRFGYFQNHNKNAFDETLRRDAIRLVGEIKDARKKLVHKWIDSVEWLAPCFEKAWHENKIPLFSRIPKDIHIYFHGNSVDLNSEKVDTDKGHFSTAPLMMLKEIANTLAGNPNVRRNFVTKLATAYRRWLEYKSGPAKIPEPVHEELLKLYQVSSPSE